ncbi:ghrelin-like [Polypterus senegalus]|uniref:ghrelin-like n=1 Tax=Polypterus senegalus TaxID=55291 RepID=UPI001964E023|nr:ghrelin-like [Polypterus senegalus]
MLLRIAVCGFFFLCVLSLGMERAEAGSSFLSPSSYTPQGKPAKKPINNKFNRRDLESPLQFLESHFQEETADKEFTFNAPFEIGITMSESQFLEYGHLLQKLLADVFGDNTIDQ